LLVGLKHVNTYFTWQLNYDVHDKAVCLLHWQKSWSQWSMFLFPFCLYTVEPHVMMQPLLFTQLHIHCYGLIQDEQKCTDKLQGVNLCCTTRKSVCCKIVLRVTAYRKSKCTKYPAWTSMGDAHLNGYCLIYWQIPVIQSISHLLCIIVGHRWLL
jgi:hypothetical protein